MKTFKLIPMGAALLALGLGLASAVPPRAMARDEATTKVDRTLIRVAQDDRDRDDTNGNNDDSGYLGVQVQRLSAALRRAKGIPESTEGTLVSSVEDQSPADEGGIKRGDVILEVNRKPVNNEDDFRKAQAELKSGQAVALLIHPARSRPGTTVFAAGTLP